jgi:hypothetical protein
MCQREVERERVQKCIHTYIHIPWRMLGSAALPTGKLACPMVLGSPNMSSSWTVKRIDASSGMEMEKDISSSHTGQRPLSATVRVLYLLLSSSIPTISTSTNGDAMPRVGLTK